MVLLKVRDSDDDDDEYHRVRSGGDISIEEAAEVLRREGGEDYVETENAIAFMRDSAGKPQRDEWYGTKHIVEWRLGIERVVVVDDPAKPQKTKVEEHVPPHGQTVSGNIP